MLVLSTRRRSPRAQWAATPDGGRGHEGLRGSGLHYKRRCHAQEDCGGNWTYAHLPMR